MSAWSVGRRVLAVVVAFAFGLALASFVAPASQVQAASNCTYYQNGSYTTVVGRFGTDCCNNPVAWGRKTKYVVCGGCFPCDPPPR